MECDIWGRVATRCALRTGASGSSGELSGGVGAELGLSLSLSEVSRGLAGGSTPLSSGQL